MENKEGNNQMIYSSQNILSLVVYMSKNHNLFLSDLILTRLNWSISSTM